MIIFNIRYYNKINMEKDEIRELGINIGANRAEIKGDNVVFIFNVATTEDMQEQDCISSVYSQANEILKEAGLTINSVKANKFNAENTTNEVKIICKENKDINKEYDNMEKKIMKDSINNIKQQLNNPWLSQETKDELREKLYDLQHENKVKKLKDSIDNDLSIHEMAALAFYLRYDMGSVFDELAEEYLDEIDRTAVFYKQIRDHERNNDRAFFNNIMNAYYSSKEDYEDVLKDAVRDYEAYGYKKKIVKDAGVYRNTNTGKSKWYSNVKEEREALPGAWRYHSPYPLTGNKESDEKYFSIDNFRNILSDYLTGHDRGEAHHKDIYAPSYEAVIGAILGKDRLKQLLNNVVENTTYESKKFLRKNPGLKGEDVYDPQLYLKGVRDYLTPDDLVKMLRPEEKEKVIRFLRWRPPIMSKEQQKAYEMVHPKEQEQLQQDIENARTHETIINKNNNSEFTQLIRAYIKKGKNDYQDKIGDVLGSQRYEEVLKNDAMFIPQVHFQRLTKAEQNKLLDFFRKETQ